MNSGGSRRRECPHPKKLPPFGHRPRDFWALPKSCGYFSGPHPPFLRAASPYSSFREKSRLCADRSGVPLLYNHACLYRSLPHPEGKAKRLSRISSIRHRHLAGRGAGAKRPARSERSEIPVQETCTRHLLLLSLPVVLAHTISLLPLLLYLE